MLLANKSDQDNQPQIAADVIERLGYPYFITSARTGQNLPEAFKHMAQIVYNIRATTRTASGVERNYEVGAAALTQSSSNSGGCQC